MSDKKQVLVICRTAAGQMYLGVLLNRIWYSPVLAKTAEEGIHLSHKASFTLILFDGDLAGQERSHAIGLLKSDPVVNKVPLIVFMTNDSLQATDTLLSEGCAAILTKPLDLAIVYGVLARLSGQPRNTPRIPVKMRVEIEEGIPETTLTCINLSEGGVYLRTHEPLREGEVLHIRFTLPMDTKPIEVETEVVRTLPLGSQIESEPGMGLQFIDLPEETRLRIRNFVQWEMMGDLEWKPTI